MLNPENAPGILTQTTRVETCTQLMALAALPRQFRATKITEVRQSGKQTVEDSRTRPEMEGARTQPHSFDAKEKRLYLRARGCAQGRLPGTPDVLEGNQRARKRSNDAIPTESTPVLLLTGAEPGQPAQFFPKFTPPNRHADRDRVRWLRKDSKIRPKMPVNGSRPRKIAHLERDWVSAGRPALRRPGNERRKRYAADEGDLITVAGASSNDLRPSDRELSQRRG